MRHSSFSRVVLLALLAVLPVSPAATPPSLVNYEGVLRSNSDAPLTGSYAMTFRFFDASAVGNEILVDTHSGATVVSVSGGLFNVALGGGTVTDGAAALPNDPHLSLAQVFADFATVYMEIQIGAETLSPRVRVLAAPYSLNATNLAGRAASQYLDTSGTPQTKAGRITASEVWVTGSEGLRINSDGDDILQRIYFYGGGSPVGEAISWEPAASKFGISDDLWISGALRTGASTGDALPYNHLGFGGGPSSGDMTGTFDLYVQGDTEADGSLYLNGQIFVDDDGPDHDQNIYFYEGGSRSGAVFKWDDSANRFETSHNLALAGALRTGSSTAPVVAYNHFGSVGTPDSEDITGPFDVYVQSDAEVDGSLYLSGSAFMRDSGGDSDQYLWFFDNNFMDSEYLQWDESAARFEMSNSLHLFGSLTQSGSLSALQNHPTDPNSSVVLDAPLADEPTISTRGTARLEGGVARVPLSPTFGWVAHPTLGLGAQVTPRGRAALWVESVTTQELLVRGDTDVAFDFVVSGLRLGYEDSPAVIPRVGDAPLPPQRLLTVAELLGTAAARHRDMSRVALGVEPDETEAQALASKIGRGVAHSDDVVRTRRALDTAAAHRPDGGREIRTSDAVDAPSSSQARAPENRAQSDKVAAGTMPSTAPTSGAVAQGRATFEPISGSMAPGDLLVVDRASGVLRRSDSAADPLIVGVAVGAPEPGSDAEQLIAPVATAGIVPCNVDAGFGAIRAGDLLVSSPTAGHAMRADAPLAGTVLGKALEAVSAGQATIRVLLMPH